MRFEDFITRLDEDACEQILGRPSIKILNILNRNTTRLVELQKAILNVYSPTELLLDKTTRDIFFDLLKPEEAVNLLRVLNIEQVGDKYFLLKSVNFKSETNLNTLFDFFELELPSFNQDSAIQTSITATADYKSFAHQRNAINEVKRLLYKDNKRVLLHMPTGSGKTRTAMNIICDHFRLNEPTIVIWLAHTEELCEQAAQEFEKAWLKLGNRELQTVRYWGGADIDVSELRDGFIVAGLMKLFNLLKKTAARISKLGSHTSLIIMDEAHMAIAPTYEDTISILLNFGASFLGLSATPGRTWNDPHADLELSNFFNRQKVTLKVDGYDNPVDYLVNNGYLAQVKNSPLLYTSGMKISDKDLEYLQKYFELPDSYLLKLSEDQARNISIIQKVEDLVTRHKRIILFALTVTHSDLLATCLQARNINAYSLTSNTDSSQRKALINNFKRDSDEAIVLCNYGILTTGFDAPKTSCAVICRPTDSLVLYSQMVGRAIRGEVAGGNKEAEIVTVVDTVLPGFDTVQSAFFNWEDVW